MSKPKTQYYFDCTGCRETWEMDPSVLVTRLETTTLYKEDATYKSLVCNRCGSIIKPYLKEVDGR